MPRAHRPLLLRRLGSAAALLVGVGALGAGGCALAGRPVAVTPEIQGRLHSAAGPVHEGQVILSLRYPDNPRLSRTVATALDADGGFHFAAIEVVVTGQEYGKAYRLYLHHETASGMRPIWRSDYSRLQIDVPIALDCDASRPLDAGLGCSVIADGAGTRWLVEAGRRDFQMLCASCHGQDARGHGPAAGALRTAPADLTRIALRRGGTFPRAEIAAWIDGRLSSAAHGDREMPIWGARLAEDYAPGDFAEALVRGRISNLLAYLESLQREEPEAP